MPCVPWIASFALCHCAFIADERSRNSASSRSIAARRSPDASSFSFASEGSSKLNFVHAIRQAGGTIGHGFVIFNYGIFPKSMANLAAEQVTLHWLATWWDVLRVADEAGYFTREQFAAVKAFLDDPDGWSAARGGGRSSASSS